MQRQYEYAVKKKDAYKDAANKARERNANLSQEFIRLQATKRPENDENVS